MAVDFESLFLVGGTLGRGVMHLDFVDPISRDDVQAYFIGARRPVDPVRLVVQSGSRPADWLDATFAWFHVVSRRFVETLEAESATGWSTFPVEVEGRDSLPSEGYVGFAVTGRCGPIDDARGQRAIRPAISPQGNPYVVRVGLYFAESTWDGSDIFRPEGSGFVICTDRVRRALQRARLSNLEFKRLSEFERMA